MKYPETLGRRMPPEPLSRGSTNKIIRDLDFDGNIILFPDGYSMEINASENMNTYQFFDVKDIPTRKFTDKNEPSEIKDLSNIGKEIGKHINEYRFDKEFESILSHLQKQRISQVEGSKEAIELEREMENSIIEDMVDEGRNYIKEYNDFGLLEELNNLNKQLMLYNDTNILLAQLSNIGTLLGRPMSLFLIGEPSEGKSMIESLSKKVIDKRHIIPGNIITLSSLYRSALEEGNNYLDKKIIVFGDQGRSKTMERNEEGRDLIKALSTEGEATYQFYDMEKQETVRATLEGFTSMILSSPNEPEDPQELSRGFLLYATRVTGHDVLERIQDNNSKLPFYVERMERINERYDKIKCIVEYIISEPVITYNPYQHSERELSMLLKHEKRQITSIGMLIEIITILNKEHRKSINGVLISTKEDVEFVHKLLDESNMFKHNMESKFRQIHDSMKQVKDRWMNKYEVAHLINWKGNIATVGNYLSQMGYNKYLEVDDLSTAHLYRYKKFEGETVEFNVKMTSKDIEKFERLFNIKL